MIGRVTTEARTLEEAMDKVIMVEGLPAESYYLEDSQEVDIESRIEVR